MTIGWLLLGALALYLLLGTAVGLAFVTVGASRVLEHPSPVSAGARMLLFPASVVLWPAILRRWLNARRHP